MPNDFQVSGTSDFLRLSKALKAAGETELRKELNKGLKVAAKPLIPKARASAKASLPKRGGLAKRVAASPMRAQVRTGRDPGVRITVGRGRTAWAANHGEVKHPVFGNREVWETQKLPQPDWFDRPMKEALPTVRPEVEKALQAVVEKIARGARG